MPGRIIRSRHGAGREIRRDASGRGTSGTPNLLPQCGIAALGVGLLALSFLQAIGVNRLVIPASALGGGAAVAARLFLRTPMRRHAHAASDRGTNRIA